MWKSRPGHLLLSYHCVLIVYECIYDMEQQNAFHLCMVGFLKSGHNCYDNHFSDFYLIVTFKYQGVDNFIYVTSWTHRLPEITNTNSNTNANSY